MDGKNYFRNVYSKGLLMNHDRKMLESTKVVFECLHETILRRRRDQKILEVAMGSGVPYAVAFQNEGYDVFGVDISPRLVEKCQESFPLYVFLIWRGP